MKPGRWIPWQRWNEVEGGEYLLKTQGGEYQSGHATRSSIAMKPDETTFRWYVWIHGGTLQVTTLDYVIMELVILLLFPDVNLWNWNPYLKFYVVCVRVDACLRWSMFWWNEMSVCAFGRSDHLVALRIYFILSILDQVETVWFDRVGFFCRCTGSGLLHG